MAWEYTTDQDKAESIGLQNWARSYLPRPREIEVLEAAGIPARGPVRQWSPIYRGLEPPRDLYRTGSSLLFGTVYKPKDFESRWLGINRRFGGAMRTPDPSNRYFSGSGRLQPMNLEIYGGESFLPFRFSNPVAEILEDGRLRRQKMIEGPEFQDSWSRVDPHVLWGLDQPGRYGIQRPYFRGQ